MTVIDHEPAGWFLISDRTRLFLDVNCSHGAVDYSYLIELNDSELQEYETQGREFISQLAYQIHNSAPGAHGSNSPYRDRKVIDEDREQVNEVALAWVRECRDVL